MTDTTKFKTVIKNVKHTFLDIEKGDLGRRLAMALGDRRNLDAEFDQVKASYKAKITEADARIGTLSTDMMNGFEMRDEKCVVIYRPDSREKDFYLESVVEAAQPSFEEALAARMINPVATEPMTRDDFQAELLQAEEKFDKRCEFDIFPPAGADRGIMVVGKFAGRWFSAIRISVGRMNLEERLDSEQKSFKRRADAIRRAAKRATEWFKDKFGDNAKGFEEPMEKALSSQLEREE